MQPLVIAAPGSGHAPRQKDLIVFSPLPELDDRLDDGRAVPQSHLESVVSLAASIFDTPIALVSVVEDNRQRLNASLGLDSRASEGMASICAQAGCLQAPLVMTDLLEDPRFTNNPLVSETAGIRFCAGAPLRSSTGHGFGVLCIADTTPRAQPSPERLRMLTDLAAMAGDRIELHRRMAEKVDSDELRFRLAAIVDSSDDAILAKRLDGTITSWNNGAERLYGYAAHEIVGQNITTLVPADRRDEVTHILGRVRHGEPVDHLESVRLHKDGTPIHVSLTISPVKDSDGRIVGASTIARDISERKRADELRFRLAAIVDSSDDAILAKRLDGTITSWNRGAERLYGYSVQEMLGQHISTLVPADRRDEVTDILRRVRRGEPIDHLDSVRLHKDGTPIDVSLTISPIKDSDGTIVGASTIARDIRDRKALEAALKLARDAETEASRLKSEFLATMSHEIRTPMNGVIGMTGLLLDTELDVEQREFAQTVRNSADALLSIINEILDFSKIEAGKMELELMQFDLRSVVEEVEDLLAERAHVKGLEMAAVIEPDVPTTLRGDAGRLRQILMNLLGNAIKFTDRGEVVVRVKLAEQNGSDALLRFEVADTGIGIAQDRAAIVFEPFSQADASTTRTHGGTGLGLAICNRLAELMGGQIGVRSTPGEGSCFWFTTRLEAAPDLAAQPVPRDDLRGLFALVVDDNQTNRTILEHQLGCWQMGVETAEGGERALELLHAGVTAGKPFDVALLDMEMPGMNGLELARAIRADPALPTIPLVLLTSSGVRGSATEARDAGIAAFLTKPVRQSRLYEVLARGLYNTLATVTGSQATVIRRTISEQRLRTRPRLLLAEDNVVNQQVAVAMLNKIGYHAEVVANGAEAVEALSRIAYGAVLMDCQMPVMDGYEASREIRRGEGGDRHIPIIAMTAGAMRDDRERCLAAGMDDYISKPVELDTLEAILARWVQGEDDSSDAPAQP